MSIPPRIALVVPNLEAGGGVPSVARFLLTTAENAGWATSLISLAMSSRDEVSVRLVAPRSWLGGPKHRVGTWEGHSFVHVGCAVSELETRRYAPRPELARLVADADVIQVVAGSPAWALPVLNVGAPVSLQVATRVRVERRMQDAQASKPLRTWRRIMTNATGRLEEQALRAVDAIQVENRWMYDEARVLTRNRPHVDVRLAPPGVDAEVFTPGALDPASRYVLSVGRFDDPRKNVSLLLDAFINLAGRVPGVSLVTAGAGPPPADYFAKAARAGLAGRVRHIRRPSREDLVKLYQGAEVFALSSDEEGLGVVLLEAMACGVPVVSTRSGGPDGLITDGLDGHLVDRHAAEELARHLFGLLTDADRRRRMGTQARRTIEARYAMDVAGEQFVEVWEMLRTGAR